MDRTELFPRRQIDQAEFRLAWASLEIYVDDVEDLQLVAAGAQQDLSDLRIETVERTLQVSQPMLGLSYRLAAGHWLRVILRVPREWKGALSAATTTGQIQIRGLQGSDLTLDSVTGEIRCMGLRAIGLSLRSISGHILGGNLRGSRLQVRNVSGSVNLSACDFSDYRFSCVSGPLTLEMATPFTQMDVNTVSGDVALFTPLNQVDVYHRTVSGRLRTSGVSIRDHSPLIRLSSVSGNLELSSTTLGLGAAPAETEQTEE